MTTSLENILPGSVEAGPVDVILGGAKAPPPPGLYTIDITDTSQLIRYTVREDDESPQDSSDGDTDHLVPVDAMASLYENLDSTSPYCDEYDDSDFSAGAAPDDTPVDSPKKRKKEKKHKKNPGEDPNAEFIKRIWNCEDEPEDQEPPASSKSASKPKKDRKPYYDEDKLQRILTKEYTFGCYGSSLYVRGNDGVYSEVNTSTIEKLLMTTLTKEQRKRFRIGTAKAVRSRLLASPEVFSLQLAFPKEKVLFSNGCFNIATKLPESAKESDFFATCINAKYLPFEKLKCPYFDAYLESSSGGIESIKERICAMLGYLMLPGYPGKKIIILGIARDSGKSVISRFYQRLVGPELVCGQTPFDMSESHALSEFAGKVANMAMDIPATTIKPAAVGVQKNLSGGDLISINPKGRDRRSMICYTKQVLGTNSPLTLQQFDAAFWERCEIIPYIFSISPEDRIVNLEEYLWEERDAIVTKCMKAARRLLKNDYRFPDCPIASEMKDAWVGWRSYAKAFLEAHCIAEKGSFTPSTPLHNAYIQYCQENNLPYGTMTGFITLAKQLFPSNGNPHPMIGGVQQRGLPDVRFRGEL